LRGLKYHTGLVFAAYADGAGQALANGGRYDNVGKIYGRSRPATGFAVDLKTLYLQGERELTASAAISAPALSDQALEQAIMRLRNEGEVVITAFGGRHDERCTRELLYQEGIWTVSPIGNKSL
jgi:ATP phosphoribosyltransferase regulatory subunit